MVTQQGRGPTAKPVPTPSQHTPETVDPSLLGIFREIGRLAGSMEQMNERMGEMVTAQADTSHLLQRSVSDNAVQHQDMAERLAGFETKLDDHDKRLVNVERELRKPKPPPTGTNPFKSLGDALAFGKAMGPWLIAGLAALIAYLTGTPKGGASP